MTLRYHGIGLRELQEAPGFSEKSMDSCRISQEIILLRIISMIKIEQPLITMIKY